MNEDENHTKYSHSGSFNMFKYQPENSKIADGFGEDSRSVGLSHNESLPEFHNPNDLPQIPYKDQELVTNEKNLGYLKQQLQEENKKKSEAEHNFLPKSKFALPKHDIQFSHHECSFSNDIKFVEDYAPEEGLESKEHEGGEETKNTNSQRDYDIKDDEKNYNSNLSNSSKQSE